MSAAKTHERERAAVAFRMREQLDAAFPGNAGTCGFCGDTVIGGRHRVIDARAERIRAGEPWESVVADWGYGVEQAIVALAVSR